MNFRVGGSTVYSYYTSRGGGDPGGFEGQLLTIAIRVSSTGGCREASSPPNPQLPPPKPPNPQLPPPPQSVDYYSVKPPASPPPPKC